MTKSTSLAPASTTETVCDDSPQVRPPRLRLEICRGRTLFPHRPVNQERFLIGADAECDLRLGGDEMPPLHSFIQTVGGDVSLEAIVASPPLTVNGEVKQSVRLEVGDRVEIGCFAFVVRELKSQPSALSDQHSATSDEVTASQLTAAELIQLIEQEQALVDKLESGRRMGAEALLHAARQHGTHGHGEARTRRGEEPESPGLRVTPSPRVKGQVGPVVPAASSPSPNRQPAQPALRPFNRASERCSAPEAASEEDASSSSCKDQSRPAFNRLMAATGELEVELLRDLERVLKQLNVTSQELEQRQSRLSRREANYAEAAEHLLDAQQQLAAHLEAILKQLPENQAAQARAIA